VCHHRSAAQQHNTSGGVEIVELALVKFVAAKQHKTVMCLHC